MVHTSNTPANLTQAKSVAKLFRDVFTAGAVCFAGLGIWMGIENASVPPSPSPEEATSIQQTCFTQLRDNTMDEKSVATQFAKNAPDITISDSISHQALDNCVKSQIAQNIARDKNAEESFMLVSAFASLGFLGMAGWNAHDLRKMNKTAAKPSAPGVA